jgi:phosphoribosylglycinamide formyltransferase-1
LQVLESHKIDLVVLAGYLTILSSELVKKYENRIVNVHPSLIPSFCGKGFYGLKPHEEALKRGVKVTGATVHLVNEIPDGGRILAQKAVDVLPGDTPETLQRRVMVEAEWVLLPRAVEDLCAQIAKEKCE